MNPRAREPSPGLPQLSPDLNPLFRAKPGGGAPADPPHRVPEPEAAEEAPRPRLRLPNPGSSFGPVSAVSCGEDQKNIIKHASGHFYGNCAPITKVILFQVFNPVGPHFIDSHSFELAQNRIKECNYSHLPMANSST